MANIREQCSWVHSKEKADATRKAKDIIRMSVARAAHLQPLEEFDLPVNKRTLVVGGGIAGMTCALSIARQGYQVHLVEKEEKVMLFLEKMTRSQEVGPLRGKKDDYMISSCGASQAQFRTRHSGSKVNHKRLAL